ncbi:MAG TPA: HAD family hydrolase [Chitinophagaceae bacterium]|nr:HAD family hydrolase [Chitinophagaceae bacterium]
MESKNKQNKAIFIDKDGTLLVNVPYNVNPDLLSFQQNAVEGLRRLQTYGYLLFIVTNQSGVAFGFFKEEALWELHKAIQGLLEEAGVRLDGFYYCPHHPDGIIRQYSMPCTCRKPAPGMLLRAAGDFNIDLSSSWMIGDILNDVEAGDGAGCKTILIDNGNETEWHLGRHRIPDLVAENIKDAADLIFTMNEIIKNDIHVDNH